MSTLTDMLTAAYHLLIGCWWIALIALGAWIAAIGLGRAAAKPMPMPLPPVDAPDEAFEAWAVQALGIANTPAMQRTLHDIHNLPETEAR